MTERAEPRLSLDPGSAVPVFEQIQVQVVDLVSTRTWGAGTRLPPVRTLAEQLGVAPGTVAKAYRALEQEGFVTTAAEQEAILGGGSASAPPPTSPPPMSPPSE